MSLCSSSLLRISTSSFSAVEYSFPFPLQVTNVIHRSTLPLIADICTQCSERSYTCDRWVIATYVTSSGHDISKPFSISFQFNPSTENFIDAINTVQIPDDYKIVSFYVESATVHQYSTLTGSRLHWDRHQQLHYWTTATYRRLNVLTESLSYFYLLSVQQQALQLNGTAMGSPVSVVVAEVVMQNIAERALATYKRTLHTGYVTLTIPYSRTQRRNWRFSPTPQQTKRRHTVYQGNRVEKYLF